MKHILGCVFLLLAGGISSGYISKASSNYTYGKYITNSNPEPAINYFPVAGRRSTIGSFWGAVRDGGRRKHEGIDIFARKGTPVVAVTDGIVVQAGNTPRGGKTVWLRSFTDNFTYYYAHLDKHLVQTGQTVTKGQHLGTVGNSGNAKLTPPHLHFGIYTFSGPINPLPYVKKLPKVPIPPKQKKPSDQLANKKVKESTAL